MPPHDSRCHIASRLQLRLAGDKSLLGINSVRSAKQAARRFIPFNGSFCRGQWENWPYIKILVSETPPEIVPTRLSMADFAIRRAHKSALEERHVRAQILKFPDCQLLEHFRRAHVFALNMIQSRYDLQAGVITDLHSSGLRITQVCTASAGTPPHDSRCHIASRLQLCLAGEGSLLGINSVRSARQAA